MPSVTPIRRSHDLFVQIPAPDLKLAPPGQRLVSLSASTRVPGSAYPTGGVDPDGHVTTTAVVPALRHNGDSDRVVHGTPTTSTPHPDDEGFYTYADAHGSSTLAHRVNAAAEALEGAGLLTQRPVSGSLRWEDMIHIMSSANNGWNKSIQVDPSTLTDAQRAAVASVRSLVDDISARKFGSS